MGPLAALTGVAPPAALTGVAPPESLLQLQFGGGFIELAILFAVLAIVAAVLGARGVAGISMEIARWLIIIFIILAVASFLLN